jgi:hypothetical protein
VPPAALAEPIGFVLPKSPCLQIGFVLPKLSAAPDIALPGRLGDHAAPQQGDDFAMAVRWDAILLATAVAGGSMLIENSHRLDTGASDEEIVATSACSSVVAARLWRPATEDESETAEAAQAPPGCPAD